MNASFRPLPAIPVTEVPVVGGGSFPVRRVYCVGRNYLDHIREMGEADERDPPFFFQKPRDSIVHDGARVGLRLGSRHVESLPGSQPDGRKLLSARWNGPLDHRFRCIE